MPQNSSLWVSSGYINNPCPSGWHVPTLAEWQSFLTSETITSKSIAASSKLKLPAAGSRSLGGSVPMSQGTYGRYWMAEPSGTNAYLFWMGRSAALDGVGAGNNVTMFGNYRAAGFSIRCIKN